LIQIRRSTY